MCVSYSVEEMIGNLQLSLFNGQQMKRKRKRERDYWENWSKKSSRTPLNFSNFFSLKIYFYATNIDESRWIILGSSLFYDMLDYVSWAAKVWLLWLRFFYFHLLFFLHHLLILQFWFGSSFQLSASLAIFIPFCLIYKYKNFFPLVFILWA